MLSILIPTYNYNVYQLVAELQKLSLKCNIVFEILCQDDASNSLLNEQNNAINELENCKFQSNSVNLGRGGNINSLAEKAQYDWFLIMDCDMFPTSENYIQNYVTSIKENNSAVIFGGIAYKENKSSEGNLRYVYGKKREALSVEDRKKKNNLGALTSNLLINKEVFKENPFSNEISQYGYEDTLFLYQLESKNSIVLHIENPLFHLNIETSIQFIEKTKLALENLKTIIAIEPRLKNRIKITKIYFDLKKWGFLPILKTTFSIFEKRIYKNITSKKPDLLLFYIYKLGVFCKINS